MPWEENGLVNIFTYIYIRSIERPKSLRLRNKAPDVRRFITRLFPIVLAVALPGGMAARAAELVMFDRAGCAWCLRWEKEIGPIYPKTEEGRLLPLRRISLDRPLPDGLGLAAPVRYTPTFVILDEGREIGRITGYIGEYAFWGLLSDMVAKFPERLRTPAAGRTGALTAPHEK